ncbi:MAG: hypothetical protein FJ096_01165 [Deltaproteobacteria bacterium]|nr:hypothetical protein [Deltaproteobacteria bacterium]
MTLDRVTALRRTAARLRQGASYQWGHFGACNCGHLAQTLTNLSREAIHRAAIERARDWGDAAVEYCPTSGYPMDHILGRVLEAGFTLDDVAHLETLSDRRVLAGLPESRRHPRQNDREDVIAYLLAWADLLEREEGRELPLAAE